MTILAKYSPQAIYTVPAGKHGVCTAPVCLMGGRYIGTGQRFVVLDRSEKNPRGRAEHLECNNAQQAALLEQERIDSDTASSERGTPTD